MARIDWESQIGRRLRLRDLHVFFTVVQRGSMAKAAAHLGVSQPAVSEVIADLEHALGVRLLDRGPQGVEPTVYGRALIKRGTVVFDELKQSIRDIENLADPSIGEVRVGCAESLAAAVLSPVIRQFSLENPRVVIHVSEVVTPTLEIRELHERTVDLVLARLVKPLPDEGEDLNVEPLFDDDVVLAAGAHTRWAGRREVDIAELVNEPWILTPPKTWIYRLVEEAFRARGLDMPKIALMTFSLQLRTSLLASGPFVTAFPGSVLRLTPGGSLLTVLPVALPLRPWPVAVATLKNRTLTPAAEGFIDHLRRFTASLVGSANAQVDARGPAAHPSAPG